MPRSAQKEDARAVCPGVERSVWQKLVVWSGPGGEPVLPRPWPGTATYFFIKPSIIFL